MINLKTRERLDKGQPVFGTFVKIYSPALIEMLGAAGFDYVIIDAEHGCFSDEQIETLIRTSELAGLSSIVRLPDMRESGVVKALDSGGSGIQIPTLQSAAQVREVAGFARHHPQGSRGLARVNRSARFGAMSLDAYFEMANQVLLAVHVENRDMALQVQDLCDIDGLDIIFVGAADLSQSLGLPGKLDHPVVLEAVHQVIDSTVLGGKIAGAVAGDVSEVEQLLARGVRYIAWKSDVAMIRTALADAGRGLARYR